MSEELLKIIYEFLLFYKVKKDDEDLVCIKIDEFYRLLKEYENGRLKYISDEDISKHLNYLIKQKIVFFNKEEEKICYIVWDIKWIYSKQKFF